MTVGSGISIFHAGMSRGQRSLVGRQHTYSAVFSSPNRSLTGKGVHKNLLCPSGDPQVSSGGLLIESLEFWPQFPFRFTIFFEF